MDSLRLDDLAARVVAWHNRHPLARRIGTFHVQSVGFVALPYVTSGAASTPQAPAPPPAGPSAPPHEGGSLRERALARSKQGDGAPDTAPAPAARPSESAAAPEADTAQGPLRPAFSEDFISPLTPRRVGRWAAREGCSLERAPSGGPLKEVSVDAAAVGKAVVIYVMTAAIEVGARRTRVLVGGGSPGDVLGRRLWSYPRLAGVAVLVLATCGAAAAALWWTRPAGAPAPQDASSAPAAKTLRPAARAASGRVPTAGASEQPTPAPMPANGPGGRIELPALGGMISEADKSAARMARQARLAAAGDASASAAASASGLASVAGSPGAPGASTPRAREPMASPADAAARAQAPVARAGPTAPARAAEAAMAPPPATGFALSSRALRTRAEAEQVMAAMAALLSSAGQPRVQVEMLPQGDDWRVVAWPYAARDEADKARLLLASRGLRAAVVAF